MKKYLLFFISSFVLCFSSMAQLEHEHKQKAQNPDFILGEVGGVEVLLDLMVNPQLIRKHKNIPSAFYKSNNSTLSVGVNTQGNNYFLLDTLSLPFVDDFSANFFKSYDTADYDYGLVIDSVAYDFMIISGFEQDTLIYSNDTTWAYLFDTATSILDSTPLVRYKVSFYNDPSDPFKVTNIGYYWPQFNTYDTTGNITTDTFYISIPDTLVYSTLKNGIYSTMVILSNNITWNYVYDPSDSTLDSSQLPYSGMFFYNDSMNPFVISDTSYYWPPYNTYDTLSFSTTDTLYIIDADTVINQPVTLKVYPADGNSLWIDNYVFVNSTYPINPITIGVATLDGVNENGYPYDFSYAESYGIADYLTSKPIDLDYPPSDSIYLSFFYQPEGRGNNPQPEDSLVLEFRSPSRSKWFHIWSVQGSVNQDFKQVMIPVTDTNYLEKGFLFRFKNYATLSGNLDHWHIDYVRLDKGRSIDDTVIVDVAFVYGSGSLLKNYQSMPWKHFLLDTITQLVNSMAIIIRCNDVIGKNVQDYEYEINNDFDSVFVNKFSHSFTAFPYDSIGNQTYDTIINYVCYSPSANCFSPAVDSTVFEIINIITATPDINRWNDTIRHFQKFYNYYAYDDGTAEAGYGLNAMGAKLAYRFTLNQADTLRAVQMYFNQVVYDVSEKLFDLTIWNGITQPASIIYQKNYVTPVYEDSLNKFHTYLIDSVLVIDSGTYFVGWVQAANDLLNIGFDRNIVSNSNMFYNVAGVWQTSTLLGSWMIRPVFGDTVQLPAGIRNEYEFKKNFGFIIYPNPVKDIIHFKSLPVNDLRSLQISIYDMYGRRVYSKMAIQGSIDVSDFSEGIYLVRINNLDSRDSFSRKILITR